MAQLLALQVRQRLERVRVVRPDDQAAVEVQRGRGAEVRDVLALGLEARRFPGRLLTDRILTGEEQLR
jgi:hypothetical protein